MKKIRLAHIVNPVEVGNESDLFFAQPVTFQSMRAARDFSESHVEVELFSAQYPEDRHTVPDYFTKTPDLQQSASDLKVFKIKRKLPLLRDILERLYQATDADYLIYSNSDIAVMPNFYSSVAALVKEGYDAFVVNRRTIHAEFKNPEHLPLMYAQAGKKHPGWDCFVFKRTAYPGFDLGTGVIGQGWIGRILLSNMILNAEKFHIFTDLHLTFHIGNERNWKNPLYSDYQQHNMDECYHILKRYEKKRGLLDRDSKPGEFINLYDALQPGSDLNALSSHQLVFVAGLHRSGTTLIADCLKSHSRVSGFTDTGFPKDEGQFLQSVFPAAREFGGPGKFGFRKAMHLTEKSSLVTEENRAKLQREWGRYWDLKKNVLIEKSPPNILKLRFLQAFFPEAKFIVIIRHPVAVSMATQKWSKTSLRSLLKHWIRCHDIYSEDKSHIRNLLEIRYEDFIARPQQVYNEICRFIGISGEKVTDPVNDGVNAKYLKEWNREFMKKNRLMRFFIKKRLLRIKKKISSYGYDF